jgi:Zn-dependent M28 family amino/carboxypeptidase
MKTRRFYSCVTLLALACGAVPAHAAGYSPIATAPLDPRIKALVAAVSPSDLRAIDTHLVSFGTRNAFSETSSTSKHGVFAARDWIRSQFEAAAKTSGGRMTVLLDTYVQPKTPRTPRDVTISSVVAVLKGDDPDGRTYVMTGHYDSRNSDGNDATRNAPGADDDGSGSTAVIEAAKVMAKTRFHGTIIFACVDGEEQGLFGSGHLAQTLKSKGVKVVGDLNNDIVGSSTGPHGERAPYTVRVFSQALPDDADVKRVNLIGSENDSPSRELARFVKTVGEQYVPPMKGELIYRADRFLRGGDQESFTEQGFPAMRFVEKYENFDHQHQNVRREGGVQYGDLLSYVDFGYLARVTQMNVAALAALALGPEQPSNVQLATKQLGYDSTLRWQPALHAVSYEIVWRETTSPVWQYSKNVGKALQGTVPVSKDDYILGVRAVDANGLRSPVVYPVPVRH